MPSECPSLEELAAYIDHGLLPEEVRQLEDHLVECKLCRKIVAEVIKSQAVIPDPVIDRSKLS